MKKNTFLALVLLSLCFSVTSWSQNIVYPWRATTAILKGGESFEVWFNAANGQTVNSVELKAAFQNVSTSISSVNGNWVYDPMSGNTYNMKITVSVPANAVADRYDLVLNTSSGPITSYGGVKIVKEYKPEYYVMHMSDGHLYQAGYDTDVILQRKSAMVDIANIMDVQVLIETGDNMYNVRNHPEREEYYFIGSPSINTKGMSKCTAATFITPGDHEGFTANDFAQGTPQQNADFVNDYWGLQNHSFKYGNGRFMNLNNAWSVSETNPGQHQYQIDDAISWLHNAGSGGNFFLTAGHCYNKMHSFIDTDTKLSLVLAGDKHHIYTSNPYSFTPGSPAVAYIAASGINHFAFNLFKVNNATGSYSAPTGVNGFADVLFSGDQDLPATWVSNLTLAYSAANDGSTTINTATIDNKFNFPLTAAKVRFVVPKGFNYNVTNGIVEQEYDGTQFHIVDVLTDVNAASKKEIYITSGSPIDLCPDDPNKTAPGNCGCGVPEGTCTVAVTGLTVNPTTAKLHLNVIKQIVATITPANATNKQITWSSSDPAVATVSPAGLVTAISGGTAIITATAQDGNITATTSITVIPNNTLYQAEDAELNGALIVTSQPDYHGTGFVDYTNPSNDYIKWSVYVPTDGNYNLNFRYALASGSRPLNLNVNGVNKNSLTFPVTGSFAVWGNYISSQALKAGTNTITLTAIGSSGGNFDELTISNTLGINDLPQGNENKTVKVFPNPLTQSSLYVSTDGFDNDTNVRITITNTNGQKIYEKKLHDPCQTEINLAEKLPNALYFVTVQSDQTKIVKKLIVK
ncbi:Ig-like domain-containing protein [Flavobacterium nackdongense]|nr:Ig-like domain-containing protein [Flavobacterium nackdongense]